MSMLVISASAPRWANTEQTLIDLQVQIDGIGGELPFTAGKNDCESHGRELFARAMAGDFGVVAAYMPPAPEPAPAPTKEQLLAQLQALQAQIQALE